jgi:hypothetical protein
MEGSELPEIIYGTAVFAEAPCLNIFSTEKKEACIINFEFNRKEGERCKAVGAGECFKKFAC